MTTPTPANRPATEMDWKLWLVENLYFGAHPDALKGFLVEQGYKANAIQHEINNIAASPAFRAAGPYIRLARRASQLEERARRYRAYGPQGVERRSGLTPQAFYREYVANNRPVVLTDALSALPAMQKWSFGYLREAVGAQRVSVMAGRDADPRFQQNQDAHKHELTFSAFLDLIERSGPSNDLYMVGHNGNLERPELAPLLADLQPFPAMLAPSIPQLWVGPAGTRSLLYRDPAPMLLCQVAGRKRVTLMSPSEPGLLMSEEGLTSPIDLEHADLDRFPEVRDAQAFNVELAAGEALYLPFDWWHQERSLEAGITVGFDHFLSADEVAALK